MKPSLRELIGLKGISVSKISRATGIHKAHVSAFVRGDKKTSSKRSRRILRDYFTKVGILPAPKPRPRCQCLSCGKVHARARIKSTDPIPMRNQ